MAQQLGALAALAEDPGSNLNTHIVANNSPLTPIPGDPKPSNLHRHCRTPNALTYMQAINSYI